MFSSLRWLDLQFPLWPFAASLPSLFKLSQSLNSSFLNCITLSESSFLSLSGSFCQLLSQVHVHVSISLSLAMLICLSFSLRSFLKWLNSAHRLSFLLFNTLFPFANRSLSSPFPLSECRESDEVRWFTHLSFSYPLLHFLINPLQATSSIISFLQSRRELMSTSILFCMSFFSSRSCCHISNIPSPSGPWSFYSFPC